MRWPPRSPTRTDKDAGGRGDAAEACALAYLRRRGLRLVQANYRCRGGEIDLIMRDGDFLALIEVRYRADQAFGGAAASVTPGKRRRIVQAARHFLAYHPDAGDAPALRFDVLALDGPLHRPRIEWIRDAFRVDD